MKITKLETLHCDAGWRVNSFLKISTDEGITGWSEFMEGYGAQGLATVIEKSGRAPSRTGPAPGRAPQHFSLRGDPPSGGRAQRPGDRRDRERAGRHQSQGARSPGLRAARRPIPRPDAGLLVALRHLPRPLRRPDQRMGRGRAGAHPRRYRRARPRGARERLQGAQDQSDPLRAGGRHYMYGPGTGNQPGFPELNVDSDIAAAAVDQLSAFREGAGKGVGLHLDTNFNYKIDGYIRLARALEPLDMVWLEIDLYDPPAWRASAIPAARRSPRSSRSMAAASSARISRTSRSITRSSTSPGTASSNW